MALHEPRTTQPQASKNQSQMHPKRIKTPDLSDVQNRVIQRDMINVSVKDISQSENKSVFHVTIL